MPARLRRDELRIPCRNPRPTAGADPGASAWSGGSGVAGER
ncbi:hypothetical protein ACTJJE_09940 [Mycolicibacterium sp. 22603]